MHYTILLCSVTIQNKSAIDIHIFPPFWNTLPSPSSSHNQVWAFFMGFHLAAALNQMAPRKIFQLCLFLFLSAISCLHYRTVIFGLRVEHSIFPGLYNNMSVHNSPFPKLQQEGNSCFPVPNVPDTSASLSRSSHQPST